MLIEFRVSNYRSIASEQVISLIPALGQSDFPNNILTRGRFQSLNVFALYGANNSGKTNLLQGIDVLDHLLQMSSSSNSTTKLPYDPNLLVKGYENKPTKFEITFVIDENRYRYGVEYDEEQIISEWLYRKKIGREVELFFREGETIDVSSGINGKTRLIDTAIDATRKNGLFLSSCDMLNVEEAKIIFSWFAKLITVDGLGSGDEGTINTINLLEADSSYRDKILEHIRKLDLGIVDIEILKQKFDPNELPDYLDSNTKDPIIRDLTGKMGYQPNVVRHIYTKNGDKTDDQIIWSLVERESAGTKKAFSLSGPIVYSLLNGGVLIVDEIEAKMHTKLTSKIVDLFLSTKTNPKGAQLIFATHDTNLLKESSLRRDQINFVELGKSKSTEIYSLSDFRYYNGNKERPDTDKEKRYLEGRYGAVPVIEDFSDFIQAM